MKIGGKMKIKCTFIYSDNLSYELFSEYLDKTGIVCFSSYHFDELLDQTHEGDILLLETNTINYDLLSHHNYTVLILLTSVNKKEIVNLKGYKKIIIINKPVSFIYFNNILQSIFKNNEYLPTI